MKKTIRNVTYDTELASIVKKNTFSFYGDPKGYEETLYVTEQGKYFLYTNGGKDSKYKEENIKTLTKEKVEAFKKN